MSPTPPPKPQNPLLTWLGSEQFVGGMVAFLTICTAALAYQATLADSLETEANVEGEKALSLSNTEYLTANQDILYDYDMFDGYTIHEESNPELADYYQGNFSEALEASFNRPDGPFDQAYEDEMYAEADRLYDEALLHFEEAEEHGDKSDQYQLASLLFGVALALMAWASMRPETSLLRPLFVACGTLTTLLALGLFIITLLG